MSEIVSDTLRELSPSESSRYSIVSVLKDGANGRIFLAEKEGKRFILKAPATDSGRAVERLRREWELSIGLSHPGLAYVFTWEEDSPVGPCLVQEWVDGRTLDAFLQESPSLPARKRVFEQLLDVLSYLHRKGVIHNDLSPANILITKTDNAVKIIDLGFADDDGHYYTKGLGGTRGYASPELLAGTPTDARSDIWTVGALMQALFPHRYGRIVRRCLQASPDQRYASIDALAKAWKSYWRPLQISLGALTVLALGLLIAALASTLRQLDEMKDSQQTATQQIDSLRKEAESRIEELDAASSQIEAIKQQGEASSRKLDSLKKKEEARERALSAAKAEVDAWYAREIPIFRKSLKDARSQKDVSDAWIVFLDKIKVVNFDIPDRAPESIRPVLRDYIIQRYNDTVLPVNQEMNERLLELSRTQTP